MARKSMKISFFNCFRPDCTVESEGHEMSDGKRRENRRSLRGLRRLAKAVLYDIMLVKKIACKKSKHKVCASKHNTLSTKTKHAPNSANISLTNDLKTDSIYDSVHSSLNSSSSKTSTRYCSSSGSSLISTNSFGRYEDFDYKQNEKPSARNMLIGKSQGLNTCLCLFVVCLLVLTCWGKVWAIFCTSTLFILVPMRVKCVKSMGHGRVWLRETDLKEHNKRVVMEGLLARTP